MKPHFLYEGTIVHRRYQPIPHQFRYHIFQFLLNLDIVSDIDTISPWLSYEAFNYVSFYREKYFCKGHADLKTAVLEKLGVTNDLHNYEVYLLTNLSFLRHCFNPLSLYFVYKKGLFKSLIAEVTNTPWHERHLYILDKPIFLKDSVFQFESPKELHVSPFMTMDYKYEFRLKKTDDKIILHINNIQNDRITFDATLNLNGALLTSSSLHKMLKKYPLQSQRNTFLIYWHAYRLWLKGIPFQPHPKTIKNG